MTEAAQHLTRSELSFGSATPRWLGRMLRVRVLHKIWVADAVLVLLSALLAGGLAARAAGRWSLWLAAAAALVAAAWLHLRLLRLALRPVTLLVRTAERVAAGDETARAPASALADPEVSHLVAIFNRALDTVAGDRRRLRDLAARAQDAQEAERIRIARTLHEETVQTLTALLLGLRVLRRSSDRAEREAVLDAMRDDLVAATEAVRSAARELRPAALSDLGVADAIESYAREVCAQAGLELHFSAEPMGHVLAPEPATNFYRILQEALDNAARHAHASTLRLRLRRRGDCVEGLLQDDGEGFDVGEMLGRGPCLGLLAMEERAARSGATLRVTSHRRGGTSVRVRFPAPVTASPRLMATRA